VPQHTVDGSTDVLASGLGETGGDTALSRIDEGFEKNEGGRERTHEGNTPSNLNSYFTPGCFSTISTTRSIALTRSDTLERSLSRRKRRSSTRARDCWKSGSTGRGVDGGIGGGYATVQD
jgi:hypothetical protein